MESNNDSLPYIDDIPTEEEINPRQYNLRIIENYHNRNRNIEITNRLPNDTANSLSPVAPLADETEFSDSLEEYSCKHIRKELPKNSGVKLVIKGWNSSISIQGLDNKSSITFKRRCEKVQKRMETSEERSKPIVNEEKPVEKSRKGRWKMLTRSIMLAKSARFERRGLDERYPKYVLLKNEDEEAESVKENYPKMFPFNDKSTKQKPEFSFKKSFKNKTEPIVPLDEILAKAGENQKNVKKQKKPLTERNLTLKKKNVVERRKSMTAGKKLRPPPQPEVDVPQRPLPHGQVSNEIQDVFEDTLKLLPPEVDAQHPGEMCHQSERLDYYTSVSPEFCQLSCHDPYCCLAPHSQPPKYFPVYASHKAHIHKTSNVQTKYTYRQDSAEGKQNQSDEDISLGNFRFGILSSFFPRVVIMNSIPNDDVRVEEEQNSAANEPELQNFQPPKMEVVNNLEEETKTTLEVPQQDLTLKSKMVREAVEPVPVIQDFFLSEVDLKEFPSLDDEQKAKSQGSEETEYLHYTELDPPENESVERPTPPLLPESETKETADKTPPSADLDGNSETLSLTKIGYKMYDNLTKLSLNREKEITEKAEVSGCGCNGNGTTKSPYNITLESNNSVVKVAVPENELNFQFVNSEGGDIQIGVMRGGKEKKTVRKDELWHSDNSRRALVLRSSDNQEDDSVSNSRSKGFQKLKVSLPDNQEVVFMMETNKKEAQKEEKTKEKSTKEMKVGTDDFDLAGGDFVCAFGNLIPSTEKVSNKREDGHYKNLSPRLKQLLKHLHEKLDIVEKERKFLDEKINQKFIDQKFQPDILPGVFLVKHVSPRLPPVKKPPEISFRKPKKETDTQAGELREYYCEECLATMRIFEDENPSVKSMVDKFETIIQLESY